MKRLLTLLKQVSFLAAFSFLSGALMVAGEGRAQSLQDTAPVATDLTEQQKAAVERGRRLFDLRFLPVPAEGLPGGGLGPLYMRSACSACHGGAGRGVVPEEDDASLVGGAVLSAKPHFAYGMEIHTRSVPPVRHEGNIRLQWETGSGEFLDGEKFALRKPLISLDQANYGPPPPVLSLRMAPSLFGLGLLQSVPDIEILTWADPQDANGDGISGRPNFVRDPVLGDRVLGRFGWKADQASLSGTNALNAVTFMGLTSSRFPNEPCAPTQQDCVAQSPATGLDLADGVLRDLTAFIEALRRPVRRNADDPVVLRGRDVFREVNCNGCHRERMTTAEAVPGASFLAGQEIYPYTDLLLHDMGDELDDGRQSGRASTWEWRTPPLWGLSRNVERAGDIGFLHDGRARNLTEAILWHGGEALNSRNAFFVLPKEDRDALLVFLQSL